MRIELTSAFTTLAVSEGTLQNVSRLAQIELSSAQTENTGIVLNPGDILQFKSDVTLYARAVWKNAEPTEKVFLAHEPFKGKGEGGDNVLTYKGSVATYADLPSTHNVGDVYNIETADETHGILVGDNVAWNGTSWDRLAGIYAIMQGATSSAAGKAGLAPAPAAGDETKVLFGDGTYKNITAFNKREIITTSGTYVAPVTGWYKITVKGGGGGGGGSVTSTSMAQSGGCGGEGGTTIGFERMTAGQTASVVIGAGGTGGAAGNNNGSAGGNSTVTVNNNTYTGGGGKADRIYGGAGGKGTIEGLHGGQHIWVSASSAPQQGAGPTGNGPYGLGGNGGTAAVNSTATAGADGTDGVAIFEYFDPTLN